MEEELNALFLPLLGGFLFYYSFHGTQYVASRRPHAVVFFWSAIIGLSLLLIARLATMGAEWSMKHDSLAGIEFILLTCPPILATVLAGLVMMGLSDLLRARSLIAGERWKPIVGSVITIASVGAIYKFREVLALLKPPWINATMLYLGWSVATFLILFAAFRWARATRQPWGAVTFRSSILLTILAEVSTAALFHATSIKSFWIDVTSPISKEAEPESIGAAFLACVLGPVAAWAFNLLLPRQVAASRHFGSQWVNGLEDLFYSAADREQLVMLTLTNRKVYIGMVDWVPPHPEARDAFVKIIPYFSGYRVANTHELKVVTSYAEIYNTLIDDDRKRFTKVIPVGKILTAGEFDLEFYERTFNPRIELDESGAPPTKQKTRRRGRSGRKH